MPDDKVFHALDNILKVFFVYHNVLVLFTVVHIDFLYVAFLQAVVLIRHMLCMLLFTNVSEKVVNIVTGLLR